MQKWTSTRSNEKLKIKQLHDENHIEKFVHCATFWKRNLQEQQLRKNIFCVKEHTSSTGTMHLFFHKCNDSCRALVQNHAFVYENYLLFFHIFSIAQTCKNQDLAHDSHCKANFKILQVRNNNETNTLYRFFYNNKPSQSMCCAILDVNMSIKTWLCGHTCVCNSERPSKIATD